MKLKLIKHCSLREYGFVWREGIAYYKYKKAVHTLWTLAIPISKTYFLIKQNENHFGRGITDNSEHTDINMMYQCIEDKTAIDEIIELLNQLLENNIVEIER